MIQLNLISKCKFHHNFHSMKILRKHKNYKKKITKYKLSEFFVMQKFKNYFSKLKINRNEKSSKQHSNEGDRHFHPHPYRS